jgi:spore maturation protein CgeB
LRFVMFYHSLVSDWNHGNAHFLRGIARELVGLGHEVMVHAPRDGWSITNLTAEHGDAPLAGFVQHFPELRWQEYQWPGLDLDQALAGADVVMVHEWNDPALVRAIGAARRRRSFCLLFHDTHHRAVSEPDAMARFDLSEYDAVLAFGEVLRQVYLRRGWSRRAYTWHEGADTSTFYPPAEPPPPEGDLVWVGNWGDDERTAELREMLIEPVRALGLRATVHGVRYPEEAQAALAAAGIAYRGWIPNFAVPEVFARHRTTVHVPRRPYTRALPGIPTIRMFEALACGIPLVSAPWDDRDGLFRAERDYLVARDGTEMQERLGWLLAHPDEARALGERGRQTVLARHTCGHRVDELLEIVEELAGGRRQAALP